MLRIYVTPPPTITSEDGDISSPPSDGTTPGMPPRAAAPPGQFFQELLDSRLFGQFAPTPPTAPPGKFFQQLLDPRRFGRLAPPQPAPPGQFLASIGVKLPPAVAPAPRPPVPAPAPAAPAEPAPGEGEGDGLARNAAAGLSEGVYGTLGFPVDAATWLVNRGIDGVNAVAGSEISNLGDLPLGSRSIATNLEHYAGIPDPAKVRAVTLAEKAARAAGEGASYAIAPQALLRAGAVAAGTRLPGLLRTVFGNSNTVREVVRDVAAGGIGGGVGTLAGEAAPEPLKPLAEFGGNLAGGGIVAAAEDLPRLIAQGGRAIRDFAAPRIGGAMDQPARPAMAAAGGPPAPRPFEGYENRMAPPQRPSVASAVPEAPPSWSNAEIFAPPDPAAGRFRTGRFTGDEPEDLLDVPGSLSAARAWTIKSRLKAHGLPSRGRIRFVPRVDYDPNVPLPRGPNKGLLDRFDNEWIKGPSRTKGQPFEWDVQLSPTGRAQLGWASRDGSHLNVSLDGHITH